MPVSAPTLTAASQLSGLIDGAIHWVRAGVEGGTVSPSRTTTSPNRARFQQSAGTCNARDVGAGHAFGALPAGDSRSGELRRVVTDEVQQVTDVRSTDCGVRR